MSDQKYGPGGEQPAEAQNHNDNHQHTPPPPKNQADGFPPEHEEPAPPSVQNPAAVIWQSFDEICEATPSEIVWMIYGLLAAGVLTLLASPPKLGKSYFAFAMMQAMVNGKPFLNLSTTKPARIYYLSEEGNAAMKQKIVKFGLLERGINCISRRRCNAKLRDILATIPTTLPGEQLILFLDTWATSAQLRGDKENDSGAVEEVVQPLREFAEGHRAAVFIIHHTARSSGQPRGSTALEGAVDICGVLKSVEGDPTKRVLKLQGRFDETPESLEYRKVGDAEFTAAEAAITNDDAKILIAIEPFKDGATLKDLTKPLGLSQNSIRPKLDRLTEAGKLHRTGDGKPNNAFRWSLSTPQRVGELGN